MSGMSCRPRLSGAVCLLALVVAALPGCGGGGDTNPPPMMTTYTVGGSIKGLTAPGLVLTNGGDTSSPAAGATSFSFATPLATGTGYSVSIKTQPTGLTCTLAAASGTVGSANVTSVTVSCPSPWIWTSGSSALNTPATYGTRGVAATGNSPGARSGATAWTDSQGNLWLFGGTAPSGSQTMQLSDLWEFMPASGLWTWQGGVSVANVSGNYGSVGQAAASNLPGARSGAASWTDAAGNLWLFGGFGYDGFGTLGALSDLWEYSPGSGNWTWVGGTSAANSAGMYGSRDIGSTDTLPPSRFGAAAWVDGAGNFWLFGGSGPDLLPGMSVPSGDGVFNDLWQYNLQTGLWTWVSGMSGAVADGQYYVAAGTLGVAAAGNAPIPRTGASAWTDSAGNLWLFGGGYGDSGTGTALLNDLWKFNPNSGLWAWMGGTASPGPDGPAMGVYGSEGTAAAANVPGARASAAAWTDPAGRLWLFGGIAPGENPDVCCSNYNDLWLFDPSAQTWTWMSGSSTTNQTGVYGSVGVAGAGNVPGARDSAAAWVTSDGSLWLFGGEQFSGGSFSDVWRFAEQPPSP
jgi:N-acetylneuraminic acid mutarotase